MVLNIVYFPARGRAELARLVMAAAGQEWTETAVSADTMKEWKESGKLAFGQVPLLQDGDFNLVQSNAIARYVARKFNLYGDEKTGAIADMIIDGHNDLLSKLIPAVYPAVDAEKLGALKKDVLPGFFSAFEKLAPSEGFVGDNLSLADIALYLIVESYICDYKLGSASDYPNLTALKERVGSNENIAKYVGGDKRFPARKLE